MAPDISVSTIEERREYIKRTFPCIADCDMCGLCRERMQRLPMMITLWASVLIWKFLQITDKNILSNKEP